MEETVRRRDVEVGMLVEIVLKGEADYVVRGYIKEIHTKDAQSTKVKVTLLSGEKGIVDHIVTEDEFKKERFKFYNLFFYSPKLYALWDKKDNQFVVMRVPNRAKRQMEGTALLFSDAKIAQDVIARLNQPHYILRAISRKKPIVEHFKTVAVDYFILNDERKCSFEKLKRLEFQFRNMH